VKRNFVYLLTIGLLVLTLMLVACGPAATTTPPTTAPPTTAPPTTTPPTTTPPGPEKPQYGGTSTICLTADIQGFDEAFTPHTYLYTAHLTNEELLEGNWAIGPAGTGEADFILGGINNMATKTGSLADRWEIPKIGTVTFHIREGVKWALNPSSEASRLVNGRELTVKDIVYNLKRMCTAPRSYIRVAYSLLASSSNITSNDAARTITIECPIDQWANCITLFPDYLLVFPPEVIEKYGDINNWKNSVGSGPFILTDFVPNSSATFIKNPNYWQKNPVGPGKGNQLPYLDGVKELIIPDLSTRLAAFRTGKVDTSNPLVEHTDAWPIIQANSKIKYVKYIYDSCYTISMRTDKAELPFSKKEVRQALFLATDFNKIKNEYYQGEAEILVWPVTPTREYASAYVPLDKLPANVKELYSYNPDKAKQLLTTAGYPNGFKTTIICYNTSTITDVLAMVKSMWAKVGIDLTIDAREYAVWFSIVGGRTYNEMLYSWTAGIGTFFKMINYRGTSQYNSSYVNDPVVEKAWTEMQQYVGIDEAKLNKLNADLMPYLLEQCYVMGKPNPANYTMWWPWVKNFPGAGQVGYYNWPSYLKYVWVDENLRKQITGK
jgi:peptide/nickel transport system substrate-binding protein